MLIVELVCKWGFLGIGRRLRGSRESRLLNRGERLMVSSLLCGDRLLVVGGIGLLHLGRPVSLVVPTWRRRLKDQRLFHWRILQEAYEKVPV